MQRCPKGSVKNKKTGLCEPKSPRCPKGSRKNKKTGLCKKITVKSSETPDKNISTKSSETSDHQELVIPLDYSLQKITTVHENIIIQYKIVPSSSDKYAIFDVDWTLIKPKDGRKFPQNVEDWIWLRESVPETIRKYHDDNYNIVFLTDQTKPWKVSMIENVIKEINVPITCLIAMNKTYHKPNPTFFMDTIKTDDIDMKTSFFVGDAAGREGDWSRNDIDVAAKIGVRFYTPEEIFRWEHKNIEKNLASTTKEVVIMVGYPGSGKSTIAKELEKHNYIRIDGDALKTGPKMIKEAEKYVDQKSIIFDATNGTKERRQLYIDFAKKHNLGVRCLWKTTSIGDAMEQNRERQKQGGPKIPDIVFYTYRKKFEEPTEDECVVVKI
jgi:bifunctional polynucleotide phosphatase/kinase